MASWIVAVALIGLVGADLVCDNPHEVPGCPTDCPAQRTCRNRLYALPCAPPTGPCTPQCVCADGYARNPLGTCITFEQCDKCPGYTQYFACDGDYDENCSGSCLCDSGYERDANGTCASTAPPPPVKRPPTPPKEAPSGPVEPSESPAPCSYD